MSTYKALISFTGDVSELGVFLDDLVQTVQSRRTQSHESGSPTSPSGGANASGEEKAPF